MMGGKGQLLVLNRVIQTGLRNKSANQTFDISELPFKIPSFILNLEILMRIES